MSKEGLSSCHASLNTGPWFYGVSSSMDPSIKSFPKSHEEMLIDIILIMFGLMHFRMHVQSMGLHVETIKASSP